LPILEGVLEEAAPGGGVERADLRARGGLDGEDRKGRRGGAVDVEHVELVLAQELAQPAAQRHPDGEVHERAVEGDQDVVAHALHEGGVVGLAAAEATGDDADVVPPAPQLERGVVDVLGDPAVAGVVRLGEDADLHASTRWPVTAGSEAGSATASHSGRKMHHWWRCSRMWRSPVDATAALRP